MRQRVIFRRVIRGTFGVITVSEQIQNKRTYHNIKQDGLTAEEVSSEEEDSDISNIAGTSKITRSGRIFSPEIAPPKAVFGPMVVPKMTSIPIIISASTPTSKDDTTPTVIPTNTSTAEIRGKGIQEEPVRTKAQPLVGHGKQI